VANICRRQELGSVDGVPETKTEWEGIIPHIYTRTSRLVAYLEVCSDEELLNQAWDDIVGCAEAAAVGEVLASIFASPAAAGPEFMAIFEPCITARIGEIGLSLGTEQVPTEWQQRT